jgi:hypothetical protein
LQNEVLSAAYLDEQKMSFHSDDEKGLGSIIAALSLGSSATMRFRPKLSKGGPGRKKNVVKSDPDVKDEAHAKTDGKKERRVVLTLQLRHVGDCPLLSVHYAETSFRAMSW